MHASNASLALSVVPNEELPSGCMGVHAVVAVHLLRQEGTLWIRARLLPYPVLSFFAAPIPFLGDDGFARVRLELLALPFLLIALNAFVCLRRRGTRCAR